jgi:hypothetical protein
MGILDDAIREHLELKRAHGASEDDVRRQEAEVFGPPRQEAAPQDDQTELLAHGEEAAPAEAADRDALRPALDEEYEIRQGDHAIPDAHDHAHEGGGDPAWREDTELFAELPRRETAPAADAGAGMLQPSSTEPGPPPVRHDDEQHPALVDHDHIGREEHPPEPVFGHAAEAPTAPPPVEEPPVEEPVEEPPIEEPDIDEPPPRQSADGNDEEDVLEETPEFLQDAPEHDRLWFEQRPPRDFDFGE